MSNFIILESGLILNLDAVASISEHADGGIFIQYNTADQRGGMCQSFFEKTTIYEVVRAIQKREMKNA